MKKIKEILNDDFKYSQIVLMYLLDKTKSELFLLQDENLSNEILEKYLDIKFRVNEGYPLQYAIGKWNFFGYDFEVNEDVLIPRPETEILVEEILKESLDGKKILDIGTGSGAIAVSLGLNSSAKITASDISEKAIKMAVKNAENLGAKVDFIISDLFENIEGKFDIIVSNPPYLTEKEYDEVDSLLYFEPKNALVGGKEGFEIYQRIIENSKRYLSINGKIFFEIGYEQGKIVSDLLLKNGFNNIRIVKDYSNLDRIVVGELCLNN